VACEAFYVLAERIERLLKGHNTVDNVEDLGFGDLRARYLPFSRAVAKTNGMPSGYGIGLSIVKGILEAHNCKITVESSYGEWTRFRIFIPSSIIVTD